MNLPDMMSDNEEGSRHRTSRTFENPEQQQSRNFTEIALGLTFSLSAFCFWLSAYGQQRSEHNRTIDHQQLKPETVAVEEFLGEMAEQEGQNG